MQQRHSSNGYGSTQLKTSTCLYQMTLVASLSCRIQWGLHEGDADTIVRARPQLLDLSPLHTT